MLNNNPQKWLHLGVPAIEKFCSWVSLYRLEGSARFAQASIFNEFSVHPERMGTDAVQGCIAIVEGVGL